MLKLTNLYLFYVVLGRKIISWICLINNENKNLLIHTTLRFLCEAVFGINKYTFIRKKIVDKKLQK